MASTYPTTLDSFATTRADGTPQATTHPGDHDNENDAINKIEAFIGLAGVLPVFDLVKKYGVATSATATANAAAIHAAFADAATIGGGVYLRGSASLYPCNPLTLPRAPIRFFGDGPTSSVLAAVAAGPAAPMLSGDSVGQPTSGPFTPVGSSAQNMYQMNLDRHRRSRVQRLQQSGLRRQGDLDREPEWLSPAVPAQPARGLCYMGHRD